MVWATITSLLGVVIGGALSLFSQRFTERSASRRQALTILEDRRAERLTRLIDFIQVAQEAERLAISLPEHDASDNEFTERKKAVTDRLWVSLRAVQILCPSEVSEAAFALARQSDTVVWQGPGNQSVTAFVRPSRTNLITVARIDLERNSRVSDNSRPGAGSLQAQDQCQPCFDGVLAYADRPIQQRGTATHARCGCSEQASTYPLACIV